MKKLINYIKSLGWGKEDVKKILMLIIMLILTCVIINRFLKIKVVGYVVTDTSVKGRLETNTTVDGSVGIKEPSPLGIKLMR